MTLTNISLFSGCGGLDLGAKLVGGFKTVAYVEYDRYAQGVLMSRMRSGELDDAPIFEDVRTFDGRSLAGSIDVVSGGFPCQDVSHAGKRAGLKDGTRSGLWSEFARIIREVEPRFVLVENVGGLLSIDDGGGFGIVLRDLAALGFDAEWCVRSAADVGAPHRRERVWIVAYAAGKQSGGGSIIRLQPDPGTSRPVWPTPTVSDALGSRNATARRPEGNGKHHAGVTLTDALILNGDAEMPKSGVWPTPTSRDGKDKDARNRGGGKASVKLFATPQARDFRSGQGKRWRNPKRSRNLNDQIANEEEN